jgi:hypothetical protein
MVEKDFVRVNWVGKNKEESLIFANKAGVYYDCRLNTLYIAEEIAYRSAFAPVFRTILYSTNDQDENVIWGKALTVNEDTIYLGEL